MTDISVRLDDVGWTNLQRVSREHGISIRAAFEAAFLCFLDSERNGPWSVAERRAREAAWKVAARLDAEAAAARSKGRKKVNVRIDDEILAPIKVACAARGVSVNGIAAAAFMPWGSKWGGPAEYQARAELWKRCVAVARQLDYERRMTGR